MMGRNGIMCQAIGSFSGYVVITQAYTSCGVWNIPNSAAAKHTHAKERPEVTFYWKSLRSGNYKAEWCRG